jgi:hypothetical protein
MALWRTTASLQTRLTSPDPLRVTLRDKIVFSVAASCAVLYPLSKYFESYVYPSPWRQERATSSTHKLIKNEPEVQRESSHLITSILSACYMAYLGMELFAERPHAAPYADKK